MEAQEIEKIYEDVDCIVTYNNEVYHSPTT